MVPGLYRSNSFDTGINTQFKTGPVQHQLALNASQAVRKTYSDGSGDWHAFTPLNHSRNIYDLDFLDRPNNIPRRPDLNRRTQDNKLLSYGIADTLSILNDKVQLTLGVRYQSVDNAAYSATTGERTASSYKASTTTPAAALLFRVNDTLSLYGNYTEGLSAGSRAPDTATNAGQVFPPYKTKQQELGLKFDLGGFATTVSAFEIKRPSAYTDPVTNVYSVAGEQRNRGLELNIFGEPRSGLRTLGGLTWTDAKITKTANGVNEGNTAVEVPKIVVKLGVEYDLAFVPGVTLTANAIHTGKKYINQTNTLSIPSWERYDIGARYTTKIAHYPLTLRANIINVANKSYWQGSLWRGVGDPRTFNLSATMDF